MTPEEHQQEHIRLHKAMDELFACYISASPHLRGFLKIPLGEFLAWSHTMTLRPVPNVVHGRMGLRLEPLIAQSDDPELLEWLSNASQRGGGFVQSLANAGLRADHKNYPAIRPLLIYFREKYTEYEPSDAVKQEIRERPKA
jgi:hypothetical protein